MLKCLIDLADTCPKLLRTNLESILDLMLEVCSFKVLLMNICGLKRDYFVAR